jgi:hypothetical protein
MSQIYPKGMTGDKGVELPPMTTPYLPSQVLGKALFCSLPEPFRLIFSDRWLGKTSLLICQDQPLSPFGKFVSKLLWSEAKKAGFYEGCTSFLK